MCAYTYYHRALWLACMKFRSSEQLKAIDNAAPQSQQSSMTYSWLFLAKGRADHLSELENGKAEFLHLCVSDVVSKHIGSMGRPHKPIVVWLCSGGTLAWVENFCGKIFRFHLTAIILSRSTFSSISRLDRRIDIEAQFKHKNIYSTRDFTFRALTQ